MESALLYVTIAPVAKKADKPLKTNMFSRSIAPLPQTMNFDFDFKFVDDSIIDALADNFKRQCKEYEERVTEAVLNICHNFITPPIKGEITRSKLRWRGIKELVWIEGGDFVTSFVGVLQRDTLVTIDGQKIPYSHFLNLSRPRFQKVKKQ